MAFFSSLNYLLGSYTGEMSFVDYFLAFSIAIILVIIFKTYFKIDTSIICLVLGTGYIALLVSVTVLGRDIGSVVNEPPETLIATYLAFCDGISPWEIYEIIYNIIMFIPCGIISFCIIKRQKRTIIICFIISLLIESIQGIFEVGVFEICDLFHNTIGAAIGVYICRIVIQKKEK